MIRQLILLVAIAMAVFSCKKGTTGSPTPSGPDPSYLRKTEISFSYDGAGNKMPDSGLVKWTYDPQNRPVLVTSAYPGGTIDTISYEYGANQMSSYHVLYVNDGLVYRVQTTGYFKSGGARDSDIVNEYQVDTINGVPHTFNAILHTLYYCDASGHDTMNISYDVTNGGRYQSHRERKSYINGKLSREIFLTGPNDIKYQVQGWTNGNLTSDTSWNSADGTLLYFLDYTYSDVLSGGFYGYQGNPDVNLETGYTRTAPGSPSYNVSGTETYTFDDNHRVSTRTGRTTGEQAYSLSVFTYY